jgi:hypothetical protein
MKGFWRLNRIGFHLGLRSVPLLHINKNHPSKNQICRFAFKFESDSTHSASIDVSNKKLRAKIRSKKCVDQMPDTII